MKCAKWMAAVLLLFVPLISAAQTPRSERLSAQVPFKFIVGNVTFPAGDLVLQLAAEHGSLLSIANPGAKLSAYTLVSPSEATETATSHALVFHRYGNAYFLASIKIADSRQVYDFHPGKLESEMRAQNVSGTEEVLAASTR